MFEIQNKYIKNGEKIKIDYDDLMTLQMSIDLMSIDATARIRHEKAKPKTLEYDKDGKPTGDLLKYNIIIAMQINHDQALYILKKIDPDFNDDKLELIYKMDPKWIVTFISNFFKDSKKDNESNKDDDEADDIVKVDDIKKPMKTLKK
jgi:hypothetical protein